MITTQPQPHFIVDTESERSTGWPDGSRVYCKDTKKSYQLIGGVFELVGPGSGGGAAWGEITGTLSAQTDLSGALNGKEAANANIQTHVTSAHAPSNAQANADITKAEIEAKLTGQISTHAHAGGGGQPIGLTVLANDTLAQALATNINTQITVTAARTLTTTVPAAGTRCAIKVLTSGTSSFVITFGSGFKPTGTLATGTTTARVFIINWISDGTNLYEAGRTAAMAA